MTEYGKCLDIKQKVFGVDLLRSVQSQDESFAEDLLHPIGRIEHQILLPESKNFPSPPIAAFAYGHPFFRSHLRCIKFDNGKVLCESYRSNNKVGEPCHAYRKRSPKNFQVFEDMFRVRTKLLE